MKQVEVMRTKTRSFHSLGTAMEYTGMMERRGWAVRQISQATHAGGINIVVVLEDNR